jgi:hypothetical protein
MAKKINIKTIQSIEGTPFQRAVEEGGQPVLKDDGRLKTADANTLDVLEILIRAFPRERMTMENIIEGARLKTQINEAKESKDGILVMDDSTCTWARKMLKDDLIGPKIFGFNLISIIDALDDFERLHKTEEKDDTEDKETAS